MHDYLCVACALSDRCVILTNSKRPWVYASHYRGLKTVRFDLRDIPSWLKTWRVG